MGLGKSVESMVWEDHSEMTAIKEAKDEKARNEDWAPNVEFPII